MSKDTKAPETKGADANPPAAAPAPTGITAELTAAEAVGRAFAAFEKAMEVLPNGGKKSKVLWYAGEAKKLALQAAGG